LVPCTSLAPSCVILADGPEGAYQRSSESPVYPNCTRLSASLTFGLIDSAADPAILVIGLGAVAVVILVVVVVDDVGDDVLAHCEEVVIMVKRPLEPFGRVDFVGVKRCGGFFTDRGLAIE